MSAADYTIGLICSRGLPPSQGGRKHNEDNYLVCRSGEIRYRSGAEERIERRAGLGLLAAVADGMGGHRHGDLAASAAVQALSRLYYRGRPAEPEAALHAFVLQGHRRLRARAVQGHMGDMGTTLSVGWIIEHQLHWVHVGDSRIYHLRGDALTCLTRDHTRAEFARRDGRPQPAHGAGLAQSFIFGSRGLGLDGDIRIDAGTDTGTVELITGDVVLLCTDGLTNAVPDAQLIAPLQHADATASARALMALAMAARSDDNITVMVLRVERSPHAVIEQSMW